MATGSTDIAYSESGESKIVYSMKDGVCAVVIGPQSPDLWYPTVCRRRQLMFVVFMYQCCTDHIIIFSADTIRRGLNGVVNIVY